MDDADLNHCINRLVDAIDEDEEGGGWTYSGSESVRISERLTPIVTEALNLSPEDLWIGSEKIEYELNSLFLLAKGEDDPANFVIEWLPEFRNWLYENEIEEYQVAFPLNFAHRSRGLIPDRIQVADIQFNRIDNGEWTDRFRPQINNGDNQNTTSKDLNDFLEKSPNNLTNPKYTYWYADISARDPSYPVPRVSDRLEVLLGMLNYSATFGRVQRMSNRNGPWPARWADLRDPFVYLLFLDGELKRFYESKDPSFRKPDRPHSMQEARFESIFESIPSFENESPLDNYIFNSWRSYQAAITEPVEREAFFDFWRGIEILTLTDEDATMTDVVERASKLLDWKRPQLAEIRRKRVKNKRNSYVHDGSNLKITTGDRNILKTLNESLISHYLERRNKWSVKQMDFGLGNFTTDPGKIKQLRGERCSELEVIDWYDSISETE